MIFLDEIFLQCSGAKLPTLHVSKFEPQHSMCYSWFEVGIPIMGAANFGAQIQES